MTNPHRWFHDPNNPKDTTNAHLSLGRNVNVPKIAAPPINYWLSFQVLPEKCRCAAARPALPSSCARYLSLQSLHLLWLVLYVHILYRCIMLTERMHQKCFWCNLTPMGGETMGLLRTFVKAEAKGWNSSHLLWQKLRQVLSVALRHSHRLAERRRRRDMEPPRPYGRSLLWRKKKSFIYENLSDPKLYLKLESRLVLILLALKYCGNLTLEYWPRWYRGGRSKYILYHPSCCRSSVWSWCGSDVPPEPAPLWALMKETHSLENTVEIIVLLCVCEEFQQPRRDNFTVNLSQVKRLQ